MTQQNLTCQSWKKQLQVLMEGVGVLEEVEEAAKVVVAR